MNNLRHYNELMTTPVEARKTIKGGRLNGFTDINPMWRIRKLTEQFGPCGVGWKINIVEQKLVPNGDEVKAFVEIALYIKDNGEWSEPIPGLGGSSFVAKERNGTYCSDECFKMAYTDAIGTACKLLGMSEDVYWSEGYTKYTSPQNEPDPKTHPAITCANCGKPIESVTKRDGSIWLPDDMASYSELRYGRKLCAACMKAETATKGTAT
jgi:hypothetical protein